MLTRHAVCVLRDGPQDPRFAFRERGSLRPLIGRTTRVPSRRRINTFRGPLRFGLPSGHTGRPATSGADQFPRPSTTTGWPRSSRVAPISGEPPLELDDFVTLLDLPGEPILHLAEQSGERLERLLHPDHQALLQRLRTRGLVEVVGSRIHATDAGVDVLGADFQPLPTGSALRAHWLQELPEGESRILAELVAAYPAGVDRETLSEVTGYKTSTRNAYIQRLGTRRLVTIVGGLPCAAAELFD